MSDCWDLFHALHDKDESVIEECLADPGIGVWNARKHKDGYIVVVLVDENDDTLMITSECEAIFDDGDELYASIDSRYADRIYERYGKEAEE